MDAYFKFLQLLNFTASMGFVAIQNPSQYGLPEGLSNDQSPPDVQVYGISMYHQLHCLVISSCYQQKTLRFQADSLLDENTRSLLGSPARRTEFKGNRGRKGRALNRCASHEPLL